MSDYRPPCANCFAPNPQGIYCGACSAQFDRQRQETAASLQQAIVVSPPDRDLTPPSTASAYDPLTAHGLGSREFEDGTQEAYRPPCANCFSPNPQGMYCGTCIALLERQRQESGMSAEARQVDTLADGTPNLHLAAYDPVAVHNLGAPLSGLPEQLHHFATDKGGISRYFEDITQRYDLQLDEEWNKERLRHQGRHPYEYHAYVLGTMQFIDEEAAGDRRRFLELYEELVKATVRSNPEMLRREGWQ